MKKRKIFGGIVVFLLSLCLSSCSFGQSVYFLFFGSNKTLTALDGQVFEEPSFVDYTVSRVLYEELSALQKQAYRLIYNSVFSHDSKIQIPKISQSELTEVMIALRGDNPQILCLDRTYTYYDAVKSCYVLPDYISTAEECGEKTLEMMTMAKDVVSSIPENADDFIKELYLHNALCSICSYSDGVWADTAYGALITNQALCEGYTMAFKLLLDMAGLTSTVIRGNAVNSAGDKDTHIWNAVRLNGVWYYTDVTWDDPVTQADFDNVRHSYFNINDEELSLTHSDYELPAGISVSGGRYDYFVHAGLYCKQDNWNEVLNKKIEEAIRLDGAHLEFKFENAKLFRSAVNELFSNGGLQRLVGGYLPSQSFYCSYSTDEDVNVLHIYLSI